MEQSKSLFWTIQPYQISSAFELKESNLIVIVAYLIHNAEPYLTVPT